MRCECCDDDGRSRAMLMVCLIFYPPRSPSRRGRRYFPHFRYAACALFFLLTLPLPLIAAGRCIISIVLNSLLHRHDNLYLSSQLWVWPCGALLFPFNHCLSLGLKASHHHAHLLLNKGQAHNYLESFLCRCHHRDRRRWERWACPIVRDCLLSTRQATLRIV